jgi:ABC-type polysaccharide/polyol phosphate export permease
MIKASKAMRFFFFNVAVLILAGIWMTGFDKVHWFSYVIPAFFLFAAAVGICPGLIIARKIFGEN